ncbi:MAG: hypothetical protein AB7G93_07595 [Bdellovibrionales bacterium]
MVISAYQFDQFLARVRDSQTHAKLCESVYGQNLFQLNMTSASQLERLIALSGLNERFALFFSRFKRRDRTDFQVT